MSFLQPWPHLQYCCFTTSTSFCCCHIVYVQRFIRSISPTQYAPLIFSFPWTCCTGHTLYPRSDHVVKIHCVDVCTSQIQDRLGGDVFKIVKPLGWIALLLFAFSSFLLSIYYVWASRRTTAEIAKKYGKHKKKEDT